MKSTMRLSFKIAALIALTMSLTACESLKLGSKPADSAQSNVLLQTGTPAVAAPAIVVAPQEVATPVVAKAVDPEAAARAKLEQQLAEGKAHYEKGDFKSAIRKLQAVRDAPEATTPLKQDALRLMAFSYCVSNQKVMCKTQFQALLALVPEFQLTKAEAGHPLWGPVFKDAKKTALTKTASNS